jgi:hypothetical protein
MTSNCEFCSKSFTNRNNFFKHCRTLGHIKSTEVLVDKQRSGNVWAKYITEQTPTPLEREFLYKYFQRNWNEKISDIDNKTRIENGLLPNYITDNELYDWINTKKMILPFIEIEDQIVPYEEVERSYMGLLLTSS